jgi:hypothetical protein
MPKRRAGSNPVPGTRVPAYLNKSCYYQKENSEAGLLGFPCTICSTSLVRFASSYMAYRNTFRSNFEHPILSLE